MWSNNNNQNNIKPSCTAVLVYDSTKCKRKSSVLDFNNLGLPH